jgi:6-phosphofructokinase 1
MPSFDFSIPGLGKASIPSPVKLSKQAGDRMADFVSDDDLIMYNVQAVPKMKAEYTRKELIEKAGPRERIYFDPSKVRAGIITCGGLCPGLNAVIRSLVMTLWYQYNVRSIAGIRFGYRGLLPEYGYDVMELTPGAVAEIHRLGGSILGSSRGGGDNIGALVDSVERMNLSMIFPVGGDGTQRAACQMAAEIMRRNLKIAVVGIPKTIDNDLSFIQKSFGFETAVSKAVEAVAAAHVEARDAINGIGIVKVMGRESGFIAAHTALGSNDVNYALIPEVPFELNGENGLLRNIKDRLADRNHAVILVAEGAGQEYLAASDKTDASGNKKLNDIGMFLKERITEYFKHEKIEINLKYLDPGYIIRATPANPNDSIYCTRLGANAVHAAMAGKTKMLASLINNTFVHIPMDLAVSKRNTIDPESPLWRDVVQATGQPAMKKVS